MQTWYSIPLSKIEEELSTDFHNGLTCDEARRRLDSFGLNRLPSPKPPSVFSIFIRQFESPLIYILLAASAVVFLMGEYVDGAIILFVLFFNAVVGTIQEGKAQNTLAALKKFIETNSAVLRDGKEEIVPDWEIVPGDILILREGEKVGADGRLIEAKSLKVDEAVLTGESGAVHKEEMILIKENLNLAEQKNMVFKGTTIVGGSGKAVVVATGASSEMGKISQIILTAQTEIPLKKDIRNLSRLILFVVLAAAVSVFSLGVYFGFSPAEMFKVAVSISVSAIPEGLPIVLTLVLATGVWRMTKRNALVKKLQAVEALGQTKVIAVDKTGTLTKNEMVIREVFIGNKVFNIGGVGYEPVGEIKFQGNIIDPPNHPELLLAAKVAVFCASARAIFDENKSIWRTIGDPTEVAMFVFAEKNGFHKDDIEKESPLLTEVPFDYKNKYHLTVHKVDGKQFIALVGAPEAVLPLCGSVFYEGEVRNFSEEERAKAESSFHRMSKDGLRVVAFSFKEIPLPSDGKTFLEVDLKGLIFGGFYGIEDSIRPEAISAVAKAKEAGIKVVVITGDHKLTAVAIARKVGLFGEGDLVVTGEELGKLRSEELKDKLDRVSVFARVTPEDKVKIISAYREKGYIVAMTGDGVNDAPSLVSADLGIAMGKIGTEVAKEAADIVLLDDNFGSIVSAVEEGRNIYKTIKKVILYLFSTSIGEILTIGGALLLGYPLPVLPVQILWLNLVTDGFLDVALAMEPKEPGLLKSSFERSKKYFVDRLMIERMFFMAVPMMVGSLYIFNLVYKIDLVKGWTIALTTLAIFQWFNAWNCRREDKSIFQTNPFSNKFLVGATIIVIALQVFAVYNPFMQKVLRTASLSMVEWGVSLAIASLIIISEETRKFFYRRRLLKLLKAQT